MKYAWPRASQPASTGSAFLPCLVRKMALNLQANPYHNWRGSLAPLDYSLLQTENAGRQAKGGRWHPRSEPGSRSARSSDDVSEWTPGPCLLGSAAQWSLLQWEYRLVWQQIPDGIYHSWNQGGAASPMQHPMGEGLSEYQGNLLCQLPQWGAEIVIRKTVAFFSYHKDKPPTLTTRCGMCISARLWRGALSVSEAAGEKLLPHKTYPLGQ